jgi:hypothetical protein
MTKLNVRRGEPAVRGVELALRLSTGLLRTAAAGLILISVEAWCGAADDPSLMSLTVEITGSPGAYVPHDH